MHYDTEILEYLTHMSPFDLLLYSKPFQWRLLGFLIKHLLVVYPRINSTPLNGEQSEFRLLAWSFCCTKDAGFPPGLSQNVCQLAITVE